MRSTEARLSSAGIKQIPITRFPNDFCFVVGDASYECSSVLADFLSPVIARLHILDPCLSEYTVQTIDSNSQFPSLLSLGRGSSIPIDSENGNFLLCIAREFGNSELYGLVIDHLQTELRLSEVMGVLFDSEAPEFLLENSIEFLASHFRELNRSIIETLPFEAFRSVISHPSLRLASEDDLYYQIMSLAEKEPDFHELLPLVRFEYVSAETMSRFVEFSCATFDSIDHSLWEAVCCRLDF
jgi:hypothetical protein